MFPNDPIRKERKRMDPYVTSAYNDTSLLGSVVASVNQLQLKLHSVVD